MSARPKPYITPEQYLEIDRAAEPYFFPDIVVFWGKPQLADARHDTITDATVVIEVLSPSTSLYDRTFKFDHYRNLPSLQDYFVVAQDRVHIEHKTRRGDGTWEMRRASEVEAVIQIPSIECRFRVGDAYERVEFETADL